MSTLATARPVASRPRHGPELEAQPAPTRRVAPSVATRPCPPRGSGGTTQRGPLELRRLIRRVQQDKLESLLEAERELPRTRLGDHNRAVRDRPAEDDPRMPLRGHGPPGGAGRRSADYIGLRRGGVASAMSLSSRAAISSASAAVARQPASSMGRNQPVCCVPTSPFSWTRCSTLSIAGEPSVLSLCAATLSRQRSRYSCQSPKAGGRTDAEQRRDHGLSQLGTVSSQSVTPAVI